MFKKKKQHGGTPEMSELHTTVKCNKKKFKKNFHGHDSLL